jgi:hypothetical protein
MGAGVKNPEEVWVQYHYSAAAVRWIEKQMGAASVMGLYAAFAQTKPKVWENPEPGASGSEPAQESLRMRRSRLETTERLVKQALNGWKLDQVDAAVQMELRR